VFAVPCVCRDGNQACCSNKGGSRDPATKFVSALLLDELDGESVRQVPDDAADAGADGERRSDRRQDLRRHGDT
jgi:hypothetical protein